MGYHVQGSNAESRTIIIEDFWNAEPAFDPLLGHEPTMKYVHAVVQGRPTINNSEIRIRYTRQPEQQPRQRRPRGERASTATTSTATASTA